MAMVSLITIMDLLIIEVGLIGIMVREVLKVEDLEDLVITIQKDHPIIEVVLMVLIVPQMGVLNPKEVDGHQRMQMKIGMVVHKILLLT